MPEREYKDVKFTIDSYDDERMIIRIPYHGETRYVLYGKELEEWEIEVIMDGMIFRAQYEWNE